VLSRSHTVNADRVTPSSDEWRGEAAQFGGAVEVVEAATAQHLEEHGAHRPARTVHDGERE
jgi:hypothetical protein